jgi:hypothetical protein
VGWFSVGSSCVVVNALMSKSTWCLTHSVLGSNHIRFKDIEKFDLDVHNCRSAVEQTSYRNGITRQDNERYGAEYVSMAPCRWFVSLSS